MNNNLLEYHIAKGVTAFSTMRTAELPFPVLQSHQVHDDKIAVITSRDTTREDLQGIDAMVTNLRNFAIGARTADCVPILLYDPENKAIAAVHSGWRGTVKKISQKVIRLMGETYGTRATNLHAVIGPSIGPDSFQVGQDVVDAFQQASFPIDEIVVKTEIIGTENTIHNAPLVLKSHIDLWKANSFLLEEMGVRPENIQVAGICTYQHNDLFFSARREGKKCGRIINAILLYEQ